MSALSTPLRIRYSCPYRKIYTQKTDICKCSKYKELINGKKDHLMETKIGMANFNGSKETLKIKVDEKKKFRENNYFAG